MVCGLVHDHEIPGLHEDLGQADPGPLSPGKNGYGFFHVGSGEKKGAAYPAHESLSCMRDHLVDFFEDRLVGVEHLREVLGIVAHAHFMPKVDFAPVR